MTPTRFAAVFLLAMAAASAEQPLPVLRIEPIGGGSVFFVKNGGAQPLTAFLIELVDYPGSSYALWQDDLESPVAAGAEKRIQVSNMTVGAAPDYVKLRAAVFADGSTAGIPEKVAQIVARRKATLEAARELISRIQKGASAGDLKQWYEGLPALRRNSAEAVVQAPARGLIVETISRFGGAVARLKKLETSLAASKPAL